MELCDITKTVSPQDSGLEANMLKDVQISQNEKVALFQHYDDGILFEVWDVSTSTRRYVYHEGYDSSRLSKDGELLAICNHTKFSLVDTREQNVILEVCSN